jgi:hypothetical protein
MSILMKIVPQQKFNFLRRAFFALTVVCLMSLAGSAFASSQPVMGLDLNKIAALKPVDFIPKAEFEKQTRLEREEAAYNDKYLPYQLRIPSGWTENRRGGAGDISMDDRTLSEGVLAILGRYIGPVRNLVRSHVVVEAGSLTYEIGLRDWFLHFILKNGFSLAAYSQKSDRELEALYVQVIDDQTYSVRVRLIMNGPRLLMVRYYLPQENIADERVQQAQVINSFKLLNPSNDLIEKRAEYAFMDQSFFNYPASWSLQARTIYSIERMNAQIYKKIGDKENEKLLGQIKIDIVSRLLKTSLADEIKKYRKESGVEGYEFGNMIERISYKYDPSMLSGQTEAYHLKPDITGKMKPYEFVLTVLQNNDFYYFISLITPSRDQDFYLWSQNMEAFKITSETMRRTSLPNGKVEPNDPYYDYLKE